MEFILLVSVLVFNEWKSFSDRTENSVEWLGSFTIFLPWSSTLCCKLTAYQGGWNDQQIALPQLIALVENLSILLGAVPKTGRHTQDALNGAGLKVP